MGLLADYLDRATHLQRRTTDRISGHGCCTRKRVWAAHCGCWVVPMVTSSGRPRHQMIFTSLQRLAYGVIAGSVVLVIALGAADHHGYNRAKVKYEAKIAEADRSYLARLQQRLEENSTLTAGYREARENADTDYQAALAEIDRQHRRADELGRLRDPGRQADCRPAVSPSTGPASSTPTTTTGNELSAEATGFLLDFAADADRASAYAIACHQWLKHKGVATP